MARQHCIKIGEMSNVHVQEIQLGDGDTFHIIVIKGDAAITQQAAYSTIGGISDKFSQFRQTFQHQPCPGCGGS